MKRIKYKSIILIAFLALLSHIQTKADTALIVQKTNGTTETFMLADKPEITLERENCIFNTSKTSITIPRSDISEFHFGNISTGIETINPTTQNDSNVSVRFLDGNTVEIIGLANNDVGVYSIDGSAVNAGITSNYESTTVSLNTLSKGVYIIRYGNNTIKLTRK